MSFIIYSIQRAFVHLLQEFAKDNEFREVTHRISLVIWQGSCSTACKKEMLPQALALSIEIRQKGEEK